MAQLQTIARPCCGAIYAACCAPECYTESSWIEDVQNALAQGHIVHTYEANGFEFGKCECAEKAAEKEREERLKVEPELF